MSVDVDNGLFPSQTVMEGSGEAVAHIVAAASVLKSMGELSLDVVEIVRKYVDNWIMSMVPLDYIPGMAEYLGGKLNKSILDVPNEVSEEEFGETLEIITSVKKSLDMGEIPYNFGDAEVRIDRVFRGLGLDANDFGRFVGEVNLLEKMKRTITLFVLAIGIASVRDKLWIVESQ
ncbi:hypothetical protein [Metallosphaera hakonensis]|uniref:Uncharacterized protein n=1 Tax=Metallosphaera hakonensis JCM 8857 = DSM 7519 TaxID=1293036 RepID=A0A2U9IS67_9CREN|nr:hypothetical protein [Metallosphaera hakonensis]AWR98838.1 hypothetical protein DFR87_03060 [Metallosphaera hakonensis JCM 8857 = DSM 7519]